MRKALVVAATAIALATTVALSGCFLLSPTFKPYTPSSRKPAVKKTAASSSPTAPLAAAGPVIGTPVDMYRSIYTPGHVVIKLGASVTWINRDRAVHTVTSNAYQGGSYNGGEFNSGPIPPGGTYTLRFMAVGDYGYWSTSGMDHAMAGDVVVQ